MTIELTATLVEYVNLAYYWIPDSNLVLNQAYAFICSKDLFHALSELCLLGPVAKFWCSAGLAQTAAPGAGFSGAKALDKVYSMHCTHLWVKMPAISALSNTKSTCVNNNYQYS